MGLCQYINTILMPNIGNFIYYWTYALPLPAMFSLLVCNYNYFQLKSSISVISELNTARQQKISLGMMAHPGSTAICIKIKKLFPLIPAWPFLLMHRSAIGKMSNAIGPKPSISAHTQTVICMYSQWGLKYWTHLVWLKVTRYVCMYFIKNS